MLTRHLVFIALFLAGVASAPAQRARPASTTFAGRCDSVARFFRSGQTGDDPYAAASMIGSAKTREAGTRVFLSLLSNRPTDAMMRFRLTAALILCLDRCPDSLRARLASLWSDTPVEPLHAEHERVAYYTALLLASELFPDQGRWWNGRSTAENHADADEVLRAWIRATTEEGQEEFDSPTYGPIFIAAMLLLRQHAADADLRSAADLMTTWLLADYLHENVAGQMAGAHARADLQATMQPFASDMNAVNWLYFGSALQTYAREQYVAAMSSYTPPRPLTTLEALKHKAFEAVEWKRSAPRIRGDSVAARPVRKYTFVDKFYAVGSIPGGLVQPDEQHTWDVTFVANSPSTTLLTMQPYGEATALAEFFPHAAERVLRTVTRRNPYYSTITKTAGGSPYEEVFQHRNTVVALYDIPAIQRFPLMVGFLPGYVKKFNLDSMNTRWITFDAGQVYLALLPIKPASVRKEEKGFRLFSTGGRNGAVVQVAPRSAFHSYREFVRKVKATSIDTSEFMSRGIVRYTTVFGDRLECMPGKDIRVNDSTREFDSTMLFNSPFITSRRGTGVMTISDGKQSLVLDMPARKQYTR